MGAYLEGNRLWVYGPNFSKANQKKGIWRTPLCVALVPSGFLLRNVMKLAQGFSNFLQPGTLTNSTYPLSIYLFYEHNPTIHIRLTI